MKPVVEDVVRQALKLDEHDRAELAQDWYRERSLGAEEGFLADLDHAVEQVVSAPLTGARAEAKPNSRVREPPGSARLSQLFEKLLHSLR